MFIILIIIPIKIFLIQIIIFLMLVIILNFYSSFYSFLSIEIKFMVFFIVIIFLKTIIDDDDDDDKLGSSFLITILNLSDSSSYKFNSFKSNLWFFFDIDKILF
jgi:hypothetical protein